MSAVFWDEEGFLLIKFMELEIAVPAKVYCKTLNKVTRGNVIWHTPLQKQGEN